MSIMFIYGETYVGRQISSNCEDAVHICFLFGKKCKPGQNWPGLCRCVSVYNHADEG